MRPVWPTCGQGGSASDAGRNAHLSGKAAAAPMAQVPELLARPPMIEKTDILAVKVGAPMGR